MFFVSYSSHWRLILRLIYLIFNFYRKWALDSHPGAKILDANPVIHKI